MLSRPDLLHRIAALLAEFPDGGAELCSALADLFVETKNEVIADVFRERSLAD
jgi:hypothetical protein